MSRWSRLKAFLFGTSAPTPEPAEAEEGGVFFQNRPRKKAMIAAINARLAADRPKIAAGVGTTDALDLSEVSVAEVSGQTVSETLLEWFGSQTFVGFQLCAIIAQHWLIDRICTLPGRDAIRHGFDVVLPGVPEAKQPEVRAAIREANSALHLNRQMIQFVRFGRVFGIRVALFVVDMGDEAKQKEYYENPFNPDAVKPGTYKGISQIDPYWMTPELDDAGVRDPASIDFYEPTWWNIQGKRYHKSHLAIYRTSDVADLLKPSYQYAGISIPQRIMERVYGAERTANEAPQLLMTKRLGVWKTDLAHIMMNQDKFAVHMENFAIYRDNYGQRIIDTEDEMAQFDATLSGLSDVIDGQYDIVCAAGGVPITKVMSKSPKGGLGQSGNYEEASYHEELETIQDLDLTPFLDHHHLLLALSVIGPKFGLKNVVIQHEWNPVDSPDAKELAETNKLKAETDTALANAGAIDGEDIRNRIRSAKDSGYTGISADVPEPPEEDEPEEDGAAKTP